MIGFISGEDLVCTADSGTAPINRSLSQFQYKYKEFACSWHTTPTLFGPYFYWTVRYHYLCYMFPLQEDHESCQKRKPRLPQSQGSRVELRPLRLNPTIPNPRPTPSVDRREVARPVLNTCMGPVPLLDYRRVALTLALAFERDPVINYVLNTRVEYPAHERKQIKRKSDLILSLFEYYVYECMSMGGLVVAIKDNNVELELILKRLKLLVMAKVPFLGVSCWNRLSYDRLYKSFSYNYQPASLSLTTIHPSNLKFNLVSSLARCRLKVLRVCSDQLELERDQVLDQIFSSSSMLSLDFVWYLSDIGVIPEMQGQGLAKTLMSHCLENYMRDHLCYLESSNPVNRMFYAKMGWTLMKTFAVDDVQVADSSSDESENAPPSTSPPSRRGSFALFRKSRPPAEPIFVDSFIYGASFVK